jgi:hypothetical protein
MENRKLLNKTNIAFGLIIVASILLRLVPHIPNVAPVAALALFSGATIKDKYLRILIPFLVMFISDIFLGFDATLPFVYGAFFINILLGNRFLSKSNTVVKTASVTLLGSVLFFLITNFGVWATSTMYAKNISGLFMSYYMGIPFFRNTVLGDLVYSFSFFYGFTFFEVLFTKFSLKTNKNYL